MSLPAPPRSYTQLVSSTPTPPPTDRMSVLISQAAAGGAGRGRPQSSKDGGGSKNKPDFRHSLVQAFDLDASARMMSVSMDSTLHFVSTMEACIDEFHGGGDAAQVVGDLTTHPGFLKSAALHIESGDPTSAVVPLRLIALLLSRSEEDNTNNILNRPAFHRRVLQMDGLLEEVGGLIRAQDPLLTTPAVLILHALSVGPCRGDVAGAFAEQGNSFIWLVRRMYVTAAHRESAIHILRCLLASKEGIRLCQTNRDVVEEIVVSASSLKSDWNSVKNWNI